MSLAFVVVVAAVTTVDGSLSNCQREAYEETNVTKRTFPVFESEEQISILWMFEGDI